MGRQKLIKYNNGAYHVNAKTNNGDWFPISLKDCWYIFGYHLHEMSIKFNVKIHAFTLMNNHFHLLCSTPNENLDYAMRYFMQMTSKGINMAAKRKNHLWGGKYFWTHVSDCVGYATVYKYILRNPVRANLCNTVSNYPWTTAHYNNLGFQISSNELGVLIPQKDELVKWINFCPEEFEESRISFSFKKANYENPVSRSSRRALDLNLYLNNATATPKTKG